MLSLALLGPPEVRHVGRLLTFPTRKTLALLVYLAVQGGRQPREKLTSLFWPESDEERGRAALRQTLALLGETLRADGCSRGQHLVVRRDALAFDFGSDFVIDVTSLHTALGQPIEPATDQSLKRLRSIVEQYRGDFLEGFSLSDAPDFDVWASVQREAYHRRMAGVFDRLSDLQSGARDLEAAIDTSARWVAHDRWSESAHRRLIQLYLGIGDRTAALRAYETCRLILADDLDVSPEPETEALAEQIRSSRPSSRRDGRASTATRATLLSLSDTPLVGRAREHAVLADVFAAVEAGETRAVVIRGEAGIGKTRLAGEFLHWGSGRGADVLEGRAFETGDRLPYLPVVEAFRARLRMEPDLRGLLSPVWLAELARVLPEIHDRCPDLPVIPPGAEAEARLRLFEGFALLAQALAARGPTVLLVDDVQWADAASLDLLGYAARVWQRYHTRILLVLALRGEDVPSAALLRDWLAGLTRSIPVTSIALGPLSAVDTQHLVAALCGAALGREVGTWLFTETHGQPFYIVETLKSLAERGLLAEGRSTDRAAAVRGFTPPSVRDLIRVRLDRLSGGARQALAAAAVLGPRFGFDSLGHVADLCESDSVTALDELLARNFVQEADESDHFTFVHDKVREVVYADAGEPRRRLLHRRAMDILASAGAPPGTLARHARAAGQPLRAFEYHLAAADAALRLFAGRDAVEHYEQARELLTGGLGLADSARLRHLYEGLGHAYELIGQYAHARERYEEMLALARTLAGPEIEIAALNRLASLAVQGALKLADASSLLGSAQQRVADTGDRVGLTDTELNLAELDVYRWDLDAAIGHAERALALSRDLRLQDHVARSLNLLALAENTHGKVAEAEQHAQEGQRLAADLGNRALEADCLSLVAEARIRLGQPHDGIVAARTARALSLQVGNPYLQARSAHKLSIGLMDAGDYEASAGAAHEGVAAAHAGGTRAFLILNLVALGNAQRGLWLQSEAITTHLEALALNEELELPIYTELICSVLCADSAAAGEWQTAVGYARRALALRDHTYLYTGLYRWYETEALVRGGQVDQAADDLRRMDERIGGNRRYRLPYVRALSVLDRWHGELGRAAAHLDAAATLAADIGMPGQEWQVRAYLADLYQRLGDIDGARTNTERARGLQRQLAARLSNTDLRARFLAAPPPLPLSALQPA